MIKATFCLAQHRQSSLGKTCAEIYSVVCWGLGEVAQKVIAGMLLDCDLCLYGVVVVFGVDVFVCAVGSCCVGRLCCICACLGGCVLAAVVF